MLLFGIPLLEYPMLLAFPMEFGIPRTLNLGPGIPRLVLVLSLSPGVPWLVVYP